MQEKNLCPLIIHLRGQVVKVNLMIPTTGVEKPGSTDDVGVKSPEWMIQIDDVLSSFVVGFEDHAELYGWYGKSSRYTHARY